MRDSDITYMPVVIFFTCLDLERKTSFMDGHYPRLREKNHDFFDKAKEIFTPETTNILSIIKNMGNCPPKKCLFGMGGFSAYVFTEAIGHLFSLEKPGSLGQDSLYLPG